MSSVIFQPLLHDPLGWKASNTTYADTYTWKTYRSSNNKEKRISAYGQQYQRQLLKEQKLQQTNVSLPTVVNEEQTIPRVSSGGKNEDNRGTTPVSRRTTPPILSGKPAILIVEYKQRPASISRESNCASRISQHSSSAAKERPRRTTSVDARHSPKEEVEEEGQVRADPNNDRTQHWLTYNNPKTPQYLIDIKQRLGQSKPPPVLLRAISASGPTAERPESTASHRQRHFFDFNLPEAPKELRAARHRLEKYRYNPSLDNYSSRPETCPARNNETSEPLTPPNASEYEDEQLPPIPSTTSPVNDDLWTNDEENQTNEHEASTTLIQMSDVDGLPNDYIEAVETANAAQDEYLKGIRPNNEKPAEDLVYRLPTMPLANQNDSVSAYCHQQQSTGRNNFGTWIRDATNRERESAMKILRDVLHQPMIGYDIPIKQQTTNRTDSATRKLGHPRTGHKRIPCEICEKQMIKHHLWNLNRSKTLNCPHQAQGVKPPTIQVRT